MGRIHKISEAAFPDSAARFVPRENRIALGKALRDRIPRKQRGRWKKVKDRHDPIDTLREDDAGRMKEPVPIRYDRMLPSPFSFYRGAATAMAADLAQTPHTDLKVQACGDCHLMNFGMGQFASTCADQVERDYAALRTAAKKVRSPRLMSLKV